MTSGPETVLAASASTADLFYQQQTSVISCPALPCMILARHQCYQAGLGGESSPRSSAMSSSADSACRASTSASISFARSLAGSPKSSSLRQCASACRSSPRSCTSPCGSHTAAAGRQALLGSQLAIAQLQHSPSCAWCWGAGRPAEVSVARQAHLVPHSQEQERLQGVGAERALRVQGLQVCIVAGCSLVCLPSSLM